MPEIFLFLAETAYLLRSIHQVLGIHTQKYKATIKINKGVFSLLMVAIANKIIDEQ
ncbi:MAG: hypothetical protein ABIO55_10645 [Ginsengibacter sp.]